MPVEVWETVTSLAVGATLVMPGVDMPKVGRFKSFDVLVGSALIMSEVFKLSIVIVPTLELPSTMKYMNDTFVRSALPTRFDRLME